MFTSYLFRYIYIYLILFLIFFYLFPFDSVSLCLIFITFLMSINFILLGFNLISLTKVNQIQPHGLTMP